MQHELTYSIPYERRAAVIRAAAQITHRDLLILQWLSIPVLAGVASALYSYRDALNQWAAQAGLPVALSLPVLIGMAVLIEWYWGLRKLHARRARKLSNFDPQIRMAQDEGGVRFTTSQIEYYVKWEGITQLLLAGGGILLNHGNLFCFVPNDAFENADERQAFIRDVYSRLSEEARALSKPHLRYVLAA
jgi:hypothetical protein